MRTWMHVLGLFALTACSSDAKLPPLNDPGVKGGKTQNSSSSATSSSSGQAGNEDSAPSAGDIQRSTRSSLQWKRNSALEADLSQALSLKPEELCNEFGTESCIRSVHLSPLGGHNPFTTGLLESAAEPLVTTPTVDERVVLSACLARIAQDRALGPSGVVFSALDLDGDAPAPNDPATQTVISGLTKRFLARDAEQLELDTLAALARDDSGAPIKADAFAASVCLAIGTSSEFLFF